MLINSFLKSKFDNPEREMGHPRCIIPALIAAGAVIIGGLISSGATKKANQANVGAAGAANAITNQQWGTEMGENKRQFGIQTRIKQKTDLENMINNSVGLKKTFLDIWGGK